jgi:hypothetical protein
VERRLVSVVPCEGLRPEPVCSPTSPSTSRLSWGWLLCRVLCASDQREHWFSRPCVTCVISDAVSSHSSGAVRRLLSKTVSSSRELDSPSESSSQCRPRVCRREAPSMGLPFPLRDVSPLHRRAGFPHPSLSALGVSHALDGLRRCWPGGFVSPHCHVQGSPSRDLLLSHSLNRLVDDPCPLAV